MYLLGFPLLVIPFAIYNMVVFLTPGVLWTNEVVRVHMLSGELLLVFSIMVLLVEMMKSTRLSTRTIIDHTLSTILFIGMIVEFLLVRQAATGTFFLLLVISFVDVVGGFIITIRTATRDISVEGVENIHHPA